MKLEYKDSNRIPLQIHVDTFHKAVADVAKIEGRPLPYFVIFLDPKHAGVDEDGMFIATNITYTDIPKVLRVVAKKAEEKAERNAAVETKEEKPS